MQYNATVTSVKSITEDIKLFLIRPDGGRPVDFKAGQFAVLGLPVDAGKPEGEWVRRAYSIASVPGQPEAEFYVVLVSDGRPKSQGEGGPEDGRLTSRLFSLGEGGRISMGEKAAGLMLFENVDEDADILFIATGTGIAPFVSILRTHKDEVFNGRRQVALAHGVRHTYELGFKGELEDMQREFPSFHYYPVVSRSESESGPTWNGRKGHVQSLILDGSIEKDMGRKIIPGHFHAFLCGTPKMVDETVPIFLERGFSKHTPNAKGNLHFDKH
jgi:ferredoxin--NADP+ reductase